jgi:hypothetical protein
VHNPTVIAAVIAAVASIVTALLGLWQRRHLADVRAEVKNSHTTNLREDIDRLIEGVDSLMEGQRRHDAEIAGIRADLRIERRERLALARRVGPVER